MDRLVSVAVPFPLPDPLTYRVPPDLEMPVRGARVLVPLGSRVVTGCVIAVEPAADHSNRSAPAAENVKDVLDVLDEEAFVPAPVVDLAMWVADYYLAPPGEAMAAAMPPRAWLHSERRLQATQAGIDWLNTPHKRGPAGPRRGKPDWRADILAALSAGETVSVDLIAERLKRAGDHGGRRSPVHAVARALERDGLVTITSPLRGSRSAYRTILVAAITAQGRDIAESDDEEQGRLGGRQREALGVLAGAPEGLALTELSARHVASDTLRRLARRGLVSFHKRRIERDPFLTGAGGSPELADAVSTLDRSLTTEQASALERLSAFAASGAFTVALLHGVTGSGKTELYLRLAADVRRLGGASLVLVPEIALTPSVAAIFRAAFGASVAIQHSGLSDGERHDQWQRIRHGDVDVVVGTRSAVFAPFDRVSLIVVDEEHDTSYKQEETPRYNARDVAVVRGKRDRSLVVLGSATPSLESYQNAVAGRYEMVTLDHRVHDRPLAQVEIVNMRDEYAAEGPDVVLSRRLWTALTDRLARREQALVLLNRRGLATAVFCRQCSAALECPNCSVSLVVHTGRQGVRRARCHYCDYSMLVPKACPSCAGPYLEQTGFGTERIEREIAERFPDARVARLDRDAARRRGAIVTLLGRFARREIDILVGTQMIAKGHDFPSVTLVGVVSADVGLGMADFRAAERTFQLLTQVAGRAGRGELAGEAIVQTLYPDHYSILHARRQDYRAFVDDEMRFRRAMHYPPIVAMVNAIVRGRTFGEAFETASDLAGRLRSAATGGRYRVLGPAPAPLGKLRGEHRAQIFLKGNNRSVMGQALRTALDQNRELRRSVTIDVDPLTVL